MRPNPKPQTRGICTCPAVAGGGCFCWRRPRLAANQLQLFRRPSATSTSAHRPSSRALSERHSNAVLIFASQVYAAMSTLANLAASAPGNIPQVLDALFQFICLLVVFWLCVPVGGSRV